MNRLAEVPGDAGARIPGVLMSDAERGVGVVADAGLQEHLIVQIGVGLREVSRDPPPVLGVVR